MELAVNYSAAAADLLCGGQVQLDRFKLPAWPDVVARVQQVHPVLVHFPLAVGLGIGDAVNAETDRPAEWEAVDALMKRTETPMVNLHLGVMAADYPDIPVDSVDPDHVRMLTERVTGDVRGVTARFGPERVMVENDYNSADTILPPAFLPGSIRQVVEATGCGLLLDLSHARLAADWLGMDVREYVAMLPVERVREIHVSGVQPLEGQWLERSRRSAADDELVRLFAGRPIDHLPLTGEDWTLTAWAMEQVHAGAWGRPWVVTFEYGGVGAWFEAVTDKDTLAEQIPRLHRLVKGES